jgi:alkylation response protein AidB-like acyl-CoA dehydrogenase
MSTDFPAFALSDDQQELRSVVRELCDDKIAPRAAETDELGQFPQACYEALRASDFHAPHIGEEYGGPGADALSFCVIGS